MAETQTPAAVNEEILTPAQRTRGQRALILTAMGAATFNRVVIMRVSKLFLMSLGGTARDVGILDGVIQLGWLGQLVGMQIVPRIGKVRLLRFCRALGILPVIYMAYLAFSGQTGRDAILSCIVAYGVLGLLRMLGQTSWWPLLQDNTAGDAVGGFFARLRMSTRIVEICAGIILGWYLIRHTESTGFVVPFIFGVSTLCWTVWFLGGVPESHIRERRAPLLLRMRLVLKAKPARRFLAFTWQFRLIMGLVMPFWVVILRKSGMEPGLIIWVMMSMSFGSLLGQKFWGRMVDRHGGRSTMNICIAAMGLLGLVWLTFPQERISQIIWSATYFVAWGFLTGGFMMGRTWFMLAAVPTVYQTAGFTLCQGSGTIMRAAGAFIGGYIFYWLLGAEDIGFSNALVYLAIVQLAFLTVFFTLVRLVGFADQTPAREVLLATIRRLLVRQMPYRDD